jgi:superfamily II DNA or RNA helicase
MIKVIDTKGKWIPAAWGKQEYQQAYKKEIVENPVRNGIIADEAMQLNVPTLILVKQVNHGKILEDMIPGSYFLSGKASGDERMRVYEQMKAGELRVIIATTIADLGLDLPICEALILAGGGKSSTRHLQRIGRVARPYPGKKAALVIDFDDTHVHKWFKNHAKARRKIEHAEWDKSAIWI